MVPWCSLALAPPPVKTDHAVRICDYRGSQWKSTLDWLIQSTVGKIAPRGWFPGGSEKWPNTAGQYSNNWPDPCAFRKKMENCTNFRTLSTKQRPVSRLYRPVTAAPQCPHNHQRPTSIADPPTPKRGEKPAAISRHHIDLWTWLSTQKE